MFAPIQRLVKNSRGLKNRSSIYSLQLRSTLCGILILAALSPVATAFAEPDRFPIPPGATPAPIPGPRPMPPPIPRVVRVTLPAVQVRQFNTEYIYTDCFYRGGTGPTAPTRGAHVVAGAEYLYDDDCPAQVNHAFRTGVMFQGVVFPPSVFTKATLKYALRENEIGHGEFTLSAAATSTGSVVTNKCPLRALLLREEWTGLPTNTFPIASSWIDLPRHGANNQFAVDVTYLLNSWYGLGNRFENLGLMFAGNNEDLGQQSNEVCVSFIDNVRIEAEYDSVP